MIQGLLLYLIIAAFLMLRDRIILYIPLFVAVTPIITSIIGSGIATLDISMTVICLVTLYYPDFKKQRNLLRLVRPLFLLSLIMLVHVALIQDLRLFRTLLKVYAAFAMFISSYAYINCDTRFRIFLRNTWYAMVIMLSYVAYATLFRIGDDVYGVSYVFLGAYSVFQIIAFVYFLILFPSFLSQLRIKQYVLVPVVVVSVFILFLVTKRNYLVMLIAAFFVYALYAYRWMFRTRGFVFAIILIVVAMFAYGRFGVLVQHRFEVREKAFNRELTEQNRIVEITAYTEYVTGNKVPFMEVLFGSGESKFARQQFDIRFGDEGRNWHSGIAVLLYNFGIIGFLMYYLFWVNVLILFMNMRKFKGNRYFQDLEQQTLMIIGVVIIGSSMEWISALIEGTIPFAILGAFFGYWNSCMTNCAVEDHRYS